MQQYRLYGFRNDRDGNEVISDIYEFTISRISYCTVRKMKKLIKRAGATRILKVAKGSGDWPPTPRPNRRI